MSARISWCPKASEPSKSTKKVMLNDDAAAVPDPSSPDNSHTPQPALPEFCIDTQIWYREDREEDIYGQCKNVEWDCQG